MKKQILILVLLFSIFSVFAQSVYDERTLYVKNPRMYGDDVFYIQNKLIEMGFTEIGKPNGYYTPRTEEAVKTFQLMSGFTPNGHVTEEIYDFFNARNAKGIMDMIASYNEKKGAKKVLKKTDYKIPDYPEGQSFTVYGLKKEPSFCSVYIEHNYYVAEMDVFKVSESNYMLVCHESYPDLPDGANLWEHYSYEHITGTTVYYLVNDNLFMTKGGLFESSDNENLKAYINYCRQFLQ